MEYLKLLQRIDRERDQVLNYESDKTCINTSLRKIRRSIEQQYGVLVPLGPWDLDLDAYPYMVYKYSLERNITGLIQRHEKDWFLFGILEAPPSEINLLFGIASKFSSYVQISDGKVVFYEKAYGPLHNYESLAHYRMTKYYDHKYYQDKIQIIFNAYCKFKDDIFKKMLSG